MSNLSVILKGVTDPRKEGYPLFHVYGGANLSGTYQNYNSNFDAVGSPFGAFASGGWYPAGMLQNPTFGFQGDHGRMSDNLTTQSSGGYGPWQSSLHQNDQYPASMFGSASASGYQQFHSLHSSPYGNLKLGRGHMLINHVMPEGMRPRRNFGMNGNQFIEFPGLTRMDMIIDSFALNTKSISRTKTIGIGSAGYNEKTRTLVTIHSANSTACTATKFVSTVNLNNCNSLAEFFAAATVTEFSLTMQIADGENYNDKVVVVGDNGWVGISYRNSTSLYASTYDLSGGNGAVVHFTSVNGTTSYGVSQGTSYYTKMNLTWDGKWAAAYTPYYYYGSGMLCHIFSTEDPRRCFRILQSASASGGAMMPIGKSGFTLFNGQNSDGNAVGACDFEFKHTDRTNHTVSTVYSHTSLAVGNVLPSIANDGLLTATINVKTGLTGGNYTTSYQRFLTVNFWPLNGRTTYAGGAL